MDGTLSDIDLPFLRLLDLTLDEDSYVDTLTELEQYYYASRKLILNPYDFMTEYDSGIIITARPHRLADITRTWVDRFIGKDFKLIMIGNAHFGGTSGHLQVNAMLESIANAKAKSIIDNDVKVYFEDNKIVVNVLRELLQDTDTKIIKYGRRIL